MQPQEMTPEYFCGYLVGQMEGILEDEATDQEEKVRLMQDLVREAKNIMGIENA